MLNENKTSVLVILVTIVNTCPEMMISLQNGAKKLTSKSSLKIDSFRKTLF